MPKSAGQFQESKTDLINPQSRVLLKWSNFSFKPLLEQKLKNDGTGSICHDFQKE